MPTIKQVVESKNLKINQHGMLKLGNLVLNAFQKTGRKPKKVPQTEVFYVNDYPQDFEGELSRLVERFAAHEMGEKKEKAVNIEKPAIVKRNAPVANPKLDAPKREKRPRIKK